MIYTVTLNPALDHIVQLDSFTQGETNRSISDELQFGGKGINVSYVLNELGLPSVAMGFVAGFTGDELVRTVEKSGITTDFVKLTEGTTRINIKLKGNIETEINSKGPNIPECAVAELLKKLDRLKSGDTLILSGSVPPSLQNDIYVKIMQSLKESGIRTVVDATGQLLLNTLPCRPFLIKPNLSELKELAGLELRCDEDIIGAAKTLRERGAKNVLVSLGADGAILVDEQGNVHKQRAEKITAVNTVGAGDSMVAGFLAGLSKGYEYALSLSVAAGTATAASSRLATKEEIFEFLCF